MPPLLAVLAVAGLLGAIGYAAWLLSRDAAGPKPIPDPPYERALGALLNGDREEAIRALLETVRQDSGNVDATIHLGNLLREKGDAERASRLHRELTVRAGHGPSRARLIREALVLDLVALGRAKEAVEEAKRLRQSERKSGHSLRVILKAYEAAGEWERAYEIRGEMLKQNGERESGALALYRSSIGEIALRGGLVEEAKRHFKAALKLERDQPVALLRLGDIYYETGHAERAILLWKGLASAHPERAHLVLERLEVSAFERGRFSEMEQTYEELLSHNPRDVRVHLALARLHLKRGALDDAARTLRGALEIAPGSAPARLLMVQVHRQRGDLQRALDEVETALRGLADGAVT
ncbi:MAG: tetratricopeptide repeat protein, partial [Candidatus Eisenbacteria bacterium]